MKLGCFILQRTCVNSPDAGIGEHRIGRGPALSSYFGRRIPLGCHLIYSFDRLTTSTRKALWRASIIVHFAIGLFFFFDAVGFF